MAGKDVNMNQEKNNTCRDRMICQLCEIVVYKQKSTETFIETLKRLTAENYFNFTNGFVEFLKIRGYMSEPNKRRTATIRGWFRRQEKGNQIFHHILEHYQQKDFCKTCIKRRKYKRKVIGQHLSHERRLKAQQLFKEYEMKLEKVKERKNMIKNGELKFKRKNEIDDLKFFKNFKNIPRRTCNFLNKCCSYCDSPTVCKINKKIPQDSSEKLKIKKKKESARQLNLHQNLKSESLKKANATEHTKSTKVRKLYFEEDCLVDIGHDDGTVDNYRDTEERNKNSIIIKDEFKKIDPMKLFSNLMKKEFPKLFKSR